MDGVICPSTIKCREFCKTLPIIDCELLGAFEFESAECGDDGEPPFGLVSGHAFISNAELTFPNCPGSVYKFDHYFSIKCSIRKINYLKTIIGH